MLAPSALQQFVNFSKKEDYCVRKLIFSNHRRIHTLLFSELSFSSRNFKVSLFVVAINHLLTVVRSFSGML